MGTELKKAEKVGLLRRLVFWKREPQAKNKIGAPKAESLAARVAAFLSYVAPAGAALSKIFVSDLALPQVLFLVATPIAVYLDKTWSKRREVQANSDRIRQEGFFSEYIGHITDVVANRVGEDFKNYVEAIGDAVELRNEANSFTLEQTRAALKQTLKNICASVAIYYKDGDDELKQKFNASLMIPEDYQEWLEAPNGKFKPAVRFFDVKRTVDSCGKMLVLTCWAREPQGWTKFVLAVDSDADYILPGAPRAYSSRELQVIADTMATDLMEKEMVEHAKSAKRQLRNYFEVNEERFRSFFSLPLILDDQVVGILNVQSKETHILGANDEHRKGLELSLRPFCALLVALLTREHSVQSQSINE